MKIKELFSKEPCNTGRQFELDFLRMILIIRLATVHVFVDASPPATLDVLGIPYYFDSVVGGFIGPTRFMLAMGIGLAYTRHGSAKEVFQRGIRLWTVGFVLNVFRFLIPSLIGYAITGDAEKFIEPLPYLFFGNDIMQFAALAMLLMGILLHFRLTPWKILAVSFGMSLVGNFLRNIDTSNNVLNIILGHFVGVEDKSGDTYIISDFPLVIWFLFYAFGFVFGYYYKRLKDKGKFYLIVSPACVIISFGFAAREIIGGFGMMMGEGANVFYHMNTVEAVMCIMAFVGLLGLHYFISKYVPAKLRPPIESISRNVNSVYCIHWVLVWWSVDLVIYCIKGDTYLKPLPAFALGCLLSLASILLAELWSRIKAKRKKRV